MIYRKRRTGYPVRSICLVWLLIMCLCVSCTSGAPPESPAGSLPATETVTAPVTEQPPTEAPPTEEPDTEGPVISGVQPLTAEVGGTISYRDGVTAVDGRDGPVTLQVDSSRVDLNAPGEYEVIYSAEDSSGNRTEVVTTVVVTQPDPPPSSEVVGPDPTPAGSATLEGVNAMADQILAKIITDGMSQREKARAIFDYITSHMKYVNSSDKSSWITGAYTGLTTGRGDCFNYYAYSKLLLTRAGIPTVDLERVGGKSRHYWVLADVGEGYHHFDPCPHPKEYPLSCFLLTEAEVRKYSDKLTANSSYYSNYYVYDYDACPVPVVGMPTDEPASSPEPELPEGPPVEEEG